MQLSIAKTEALIKLAFLTFSGPKYGFDQRDFQKFCLYNYSLIIDEVLQSFIIPLRSNIRNKGFS